MSKRKCRHLERSFQFRAGDKTFSADGRPAEFANAEFVFAEFCRQCGARMSLGPSNDDVPEGEIRASWLRDLVPLFADFFADGSGHVSTDTDGPVGKWPWDPTRPLAGQYDEHVAAQRVAMSDVEVNAETTRERERVADFDIGTTSEQRSAEYARLGIRQGRYVPSAGGVSTVVEDTIFMGWPVGEPPQYNGSGEPCDMWIGACSCGAWHTKDERTRHDAHSAPTAEYGMVNPATVLAELIETESAAAHAYHDAAVAALDGHGYLMPGGSPAEVVGLFGPLPDEGPSSTDSDAPAATYEPGGERG